MIFHINNLKDSLLVWEFSEEVILLQLLRVNHDLVSTFPTLCLMATRGNHQSDGSSNEMILKTPTIIVTSLSHDELIAFLPLIWERTRLSKFKIKYKNQALRHRLLDPEC